MAPHSGESPASPSAEEGREESPDNAAWVDIDLPQPAHEMAAYLRDVERLLRLNPHLEFRRIAAVPGGLELEALNEMNGRAVSQRLTFRKIGPWSFALDCDRGLKQSIEVTVEARGAGSRLRILEAYRQPQNDAELAEIDRSLTPWGQSLRRHFVGLARWGRLPGYRWWHERIWPNMRPRERRIVRLIAWIAVLEFAFFLLVLAVYVAEAART